MPIDSEATIPVSPELWRAVECIPGKNDRHVLAAAITARANIIVTQNAKHFPKECVEKYGVLCQAADDFVRGDRDPKHVSTSFVERQNWSVRTSMRRYTRLSNGFSRKLENHATATVLNYYAHNFIKIHRTLRTSPAMAAGVTDRLWEVSDLVALWESSEQRRAEKAA